MSENTKTMKCFANEQEARAACPEGQETRKSSSGHFEFPAGKDKLGADVASGAPIALQFLGLVGRYGANDDAFVSALRHASESGGKLAQYAERLEDGRVWVDTSYWFNAPPHASGGDGSGFSDHEVGDNNDHNPWQKH